MMPTTDNPNAPYARGGPDEEPVPQAAVYLVMSQAEIALGYVRPLRLNYYHKTCETITTMRRDIAETLACSPTWFANTFCACCSMHRPLNEFLWVSMDGVITDIEVGT